MTNMIHAFEHWMLNYRRVWVGTIFSGFVMPILFMVGIGLGVGAYVQDTSSIGGVSYAAFIAPGLLASTAMQITMGEMTWPVFGALRWGAQYKAMQASPLRPIDMLNGHLLYGMLRGFISAVVFLVVMVFFGVVSSGWAPLAVIPATLTAFSLVGLMYAYAVTVDSEIGLSIIQRFVIIPITLFSGVFFPLTQLPQALQAIAWISPLWHGAELSRWAVNGTPTPWFWGVHVLYLLALGAVGWWAAYRRLTIRLTI
ncbi:lipooligosaccharide transport system permease protein [Stackebrandtia endophytica]|uniref:Transport permease protein n=1 Tax=Stackebrandtia endophytica TaxID=1496996 RepID=A0A543B2J2_9ACTN|nr:ABC transporter permease [Stackebrandtia endophytica]TQL79016.1 lipooligosaccharide transport system permease protein [Stackebrandtia endophytica]